MEKKYLVFAATGVGLGHLMAAVLGSAYYAYRTGRVFAMDMREVIFFAHDNHNAFFENFEVQLPPDLEVITDLEQIEALKREPDLHFLSLNPPLDIDNPFPHKVLMVPCITPGDPFKPHLRRPDQVFRINLKGQLAEALDRALTQPQWKKRVFGMHYRATVGELFERMTKLNVPDYEERYQAVKDNYVSTALNLVEGLDPDSYSFLVASDDRSFVSEMKQRVPNAFSIGTLRLDQEFMMYMRANRHNLAILVDAVTDLWALSRCEQLVYSRSAFTHFAIMNSEHLGAGNTHYIHMPMFNEILLSLPNETAVAWAAEAARKIDISRMHYEKMHYYWADALERAGDMVQAAYARKRGLWHDQAAHSPEVNNPGMFAERAEIATGGHRLALARARNAVRKMPDNPFLYAGYGGSLSTLLMADGQIEAAVEAARRAVELDPADAFLHDHLGLMLRRAGRPEDAEAAFRAAARIDPSIASFHAHHAQCLGMLGRVPEALEAGHQAVALEPDSEEANTILGEILLRLERYADAEQALRKAVAVNKAGKEPHHRLSVALERQKKFDEALTFAQYVLEKEPNNADFKRRVMTLSLMAGQATGAAGLPPGQGGDAPPDRALHLHRIDQLLREERVEDAIAALSSAAKALPEEAVFPSRLGHLLLQVNRLAEAEDALRGALSLAASDVFTHHLLSIVLHRRNRNEEAIKEAREAVRLAPGEPGRLSWVGQLQLGNGDLGGAIATLGGLLESQPGHEEARRLLGEALTRSGRFDEAAACLRPLLAAHPGDRALEERISTLQARGKAQEAAIKLSTTLEPRAIEALQRGEGHVLFSAFGEDGVLLHLLRNKRNGFYVDVGAHHPYNMSNTAMLHVMNKWRGINIDADERAIAAFRIHRPDDINLCCGVGEENTTSTMTIFEDGAINSFDAEFAGLLREKLGREVRQMRELQVRTLTSILDEFLPPGVAIDLLNVDAEGWDTAILRANDWERYRPGLILVEDHRIRLANVSNSPSYALLRGVQYELIAQTLATSIYRDTKQAA